MPDDSTPTPGPRTLAINKADAAEERERKRLEAELAEAKRLREEEAARKDKAKDETIAELKEQLANEQADNKALTTSKGRLVWWFLGVTVAAAFMLLTMIGVMIGVVQTGRITVPGTGIDITLSDDDAPVEDEYVEEEAPVE